MGSCICKEKNDCEPDQGGDDASNDQAADARHNHHHSNCALAGYSEKTLAETIDKLVTETLQIIGTIIDNDPEPPSSILLLHTITDKPSGWIELVHSLIRVIPSSHPMGPSVIALLLDDSPLPSKDAVIKVSEMITQSLTASPRKECNLCVILGCLAEKLAGPSSISLLNESTLQYLIGNLSGNIDPNVTLLSLIALEKFAQTSENKSMIKKKLAELTPNPLVQFEEHVASTNYLLRQIGFCARWCLDNYFPVAGRSFSYETVDLTNVNAMLNSKDVSEYLKISPDGLEARCDSYTFESVRSTFQTTDGCWYYEVLLITPGVMQIGWATKESNFLSEDGYGIGDDKFSIGFDGCRKLIWHNAKSTPHSLPTWQSGSILGCLLDLENKEVIFSLDGQETTPCKQIFKTERKEFFAAASFMSFQQCKFNFGLETFRYPPKRLYKNFNDHGILTPQDKVILPKIVYLEQLRKVSVQDDSCSICCDNKAVVRLEPCNHRGFCATCVEQLLCCPMCRVPISGKHEEEEEEEELAKASPTTVGSIDDSADPVADS